MHAHQSAPRPPVGREGRRRQGRALPGALPFATLCGVACLSLLAFGMRAIGFERVFDPDGTVVLAIDDAQYHARLARFSFEDFPRVLTWDPYLNFPHGARVPWPPLYDLALAGSARLLGEGPEALEHVLAWASVACAVLTALLLFPLARTLGSRAEALAAVAFFALLPASRFSSSVGNPDHHAVVALIATAICLLHAATLRGDAGPAAPWVLQGLAAIARVVLVLSWHGSILYIALGEGLLLAVAVGLGLERVVRAQAGGCALAGALAFLLLGPSGLAVSSWSPIEPSLLQPSALAVVALTGALWSWR